MDASMIALLPMTTDWCRQDLPHMTLVYAGPIEGQSPSMFNELAKDAASLAMLSRPLQLRVKGVEELGPEGERVDVLMLDPTPELLAMRHQVKGWNASEFKDFKPHATIGPVGSRNTLEYVPSALAFDRIYVGWGNESLTFNMR